VPLNAATRYYFNENMLNRIQKDFYLINLSPDGIVDLSVVAQGLSSGKITGAAIDVWEQAPITDSHQKDHSVFSRLIQLSNFIGTAHVGGYSYEVTYKMSYYVAEKLERLLKKNS